MPKTILCDRRLVLRGTGGFALALPFCASLIPQKAYGLEYRLPRRLRFAGLAQHSGSLNRSRMFPADAMADKSHAFLPGMNIHDGPLSVVRNGSNAAICPALSAPANRLTDRLLAKMNVISGLDVPFFLGDSKSHHWGVYSYLPNGVTPPLVPSIDQTMAYSSSFWGVSDWRRIPVAHRALVLNDAQSFAFSDPADRKSKVVQVNRDGATVQTFGGLYQKVFKNRAPVSPDRDQRRVVDRVLEHWKSVRTSNRRMSTSDRQRLDVHMQRLADLERALDQLPLPGAACSDRQQPSRDIKVSTGNLDGIEVTQEKLFNELTAMAMLCDSARIVVRAVPPLLDYRASWDQDVIDAYASPNAQDLIAKSVQQMFEHVFLDLMEKLDIDEGDGVTTLDRSLLHWTEPFGERTHEALSMPVVTAGGAGGAMRTGRYIDYRNRERPQPFFGASTSNPDWYPGLPYGRWLNTVLNRMGVLQTEYAPQQYNPNVAPTRWFDYPATTVPGQMDRTDVLMPLVAT